MVSQLVNGSLNDRKWSLLRQEIAERSKLFAQMSDADKTSALRVALEEAVDLGRALGFGHRECREEFKKLFQVDIPDA
jgi:hypothetical protein